MSEVLGILLAKMLNEDASEFLLDCGQPAASGGFSERGIRVVACQNIAGSDQRNRLFLVFLGAGPLRFLSWWELSHFYGRSIQLAAPPRSS